MSSRLCIFLLAAAWTVLITPLGIALGRRYGVLDLPGGRKKHEGAVPLGGGWTLFSGFFLWSLAVEPLFPRMSWVVTGLSLVFLVGYLDDMKPLRAFPRLLVHGVAAGLAVASVPGLSWVQTLIFFLWIAGMTSAFNLVDGMNGLSLTLAGMTGGVWMLFSSSVCWPFLVGGCLGVLFWNFPRARTFLGDGGSTFLGYFCSSFAMIDGVGLFSRLDPLMLCLVLVLVGGIPVIDTFLAMSRRVLSGVSPFRPDRGHLHHRLLDRGWSVSGVLGVLGSVHVICLMAAFYLAFRAGVVSLSRLAVLLEVIV